MFNLFKTANALNQVAQALEDPNESPAAAYRRKRSKTAVPEMLAAIKNVKHMTNLVLVVGLLATYGHQAGFLSGIVGKLGLLIPGVFDLGMLAMMVQAQTTAMKREAKKRATRVFIGLIAVSMLINILASLPIETMLAHVGWIVEAVVFAITVGAVGAIKWAATAIDADFSELEAQEAAIAVTVTIPTLAGCTHPTACTSAAQCTRKTATAQTRAANRLIAAAAAQDAVDAEQAKKEQRRIRRLERKADRAAANASLFSQIAIELDEDYVASVAPTSPGQPALDPALVVG